MFKKVLIGLAFTLSLCCNQAKADQPVYGANSSTGGVPANAPLLTSENTSQLSDERALRSIFPNITVTDEGANTWMTINWSGQLALTNGGTGSGTQQGAVNNILNYPGKATGDIVVYDGTNWSRVAKGSNGTFWGVNGSGVTGYYAPAGGGTVTDFSAGDLAPLFTTSEATTTSTPALSFSLSNAGAWEVFGRHAGTTGSPSYGLLTSSHIPNLDAAKITSGNLAKARSATEGVYNDQGNTYSGTFTQDISSANQTLLIPLRAAPATNGAISVNSADFEFRASGATHKAAKQSITITAGTGLSGGGDLSTNRTVSLSTPVSATNGGTGANLSGAGTGSVPYFSSGVMTTLAASANKYVAFNSAGTAIVAANAPSGFGGDGSAGAVTKGAVTETTPIQVNATTYSQTVSTTHNLISTSIINATSTIAFNGSTVVATGTDGMIGQVDPTNVFSNNAYGPFGGRARNGNSGRGGGGGGGGFGNAGGNGANDASNNPGGQGGRASLSLIGSGGPGGGDGTNAGGNGGNGGGELTACAVGAITIGSSATVSAVGSAGSVGAARNAGGGGGGPGGKVILASQASITIQSGATASVNGGAGAAAAGANGGVGGGGSGGRWYSIAPSITHTAAPTANGGAAGSGTGTTTGSAAGSTGVVASITATPTLPMIGLLRQNDSMAQFIAFRRFQGKKPNAQGVWELSADEAINGLAAFNATSAKHQRELAHMLEFGKQLDSRETCLLIDDDGNAEALRNAS